MDNANVETGMDEPPLQDVERRASRKESAERIAALAPRRVSVFTFIETTPLGSQSALGCTEPVSRSNVYCRSSVVVTSPQAPFTRCLPAGQAPALPAGRRTRDPI